MAALAKACCAHGSLRGKRGLLTQGSQWETFPPLETGRTEMRHSWASMAGGMAGAALAAIFSAGLFSVTLLSVGSAAAEPALQEPSWVVAQATSRRGGEAMEPAEARRQRARRPARVRVYTPRGPGPNSVRICHSHYEYEHRPSGTVIVPRENCYWQG